MAQYQAVVDVVPVPGTAALSAVVTLPKGYVVAVQAAVLGSGGASGTTMYTEVLMLSAPRSVDASSVQANLWSGYMRSGNLPIPASVPNMPCFDGQAVQLLVTASGNASATRRIRATVTIETDKANVQGGAWIHWERPGAGLGTHVAVVLANPGAGTNYPVQTVPALSLWRLVGFRAQLVADANVATRVPRMQYRTVAGDPFAIVPNGTLAVGGTNSFTWAEGLARDTDNSFQTSPLPSGRPTLEAAESFELVTSNIQVGDQWSLGRYVVEEWAMP